MIKTYYLRQTQREISTIEDKYYKRTNKRLNLVFLFTFIFHQVEPHFPRWKFHSIECARESTKFVPNKLHQFWLWVQQCQPRYGCASLISSFIWNYLYSCKYLILPTANACFANFSQPCGWMYTNHTQYLRAGLK